MELFSGIMKNPFSDSLALTFDTKSTKSYPFFCVLDYMMVSDFPLFSIGLQVHPLFGAWQSHFISLEATSLPNFADTDTGPSHSKNIYWHVDLGADIGTP